MTLLINILEGLLAVVTWLVFLFVSGFAFGKGLKRAGLIPHIEVNTDTEVKLNNITLKKG